MLYRYRNAGTHPGLRFFVVGAYANLSLWLCCLVRTFVEFDTQLVPHLANIEGVNIEAVLLFDIGLDDGVGGN